MPLELEVEYLTCAIPTFPWSAFTSSRGRAKSTRPFPLRVLIEPSLKTEIPALSCPRCWMIMRAVYKADATSLFAQIPTTPQLCSGPLMRIALLTKLSPSVRPEFCGLSVSARSTGTLPYMVRALSAPAAGDVCLVFVVPSLCWSSSSHFNLSLW